MTDTVSVICTVLNEGQSIKRLLNSLVAQTRPPDEIVFVDGGSTDDTVAILEEFGADFQLPMRVIVSPGANISQGRNTAIQAATGEIIASTDAGVRLDPRWLEELLAPFKEVGTPQVVAGFFEQGAGLFLITGQMMCSRHGGTHIGCVPLFQLAQIAHAFLRLFQVTLGFLLSVLSEHHNRHIRQSH